MGLAGGIADERDSCASGRASQTRGCLPLGTGVRHAGDVSVATGDDAREKQHGLVQGEGREGAKPAVPQRWWWWCCWAGLSKPPLLQPPACPAARRPPAAACMYILLTPATLRYMYDRQDKFGPQNFEPLQSVV